MEDLDPLILGKQSAFDRRLITDDRIRLFHSRLQAETSVNCLYNSWSVISIYTILWKVQEESMILTYMFYN